MTEVLCSVRLANGEACDRPVSKDRPWLICWRCSGDIAHYEQKRARDIEDECRRTRYYEAEERRRAASARRNDGANVVYYFRMPGGLVKIGTTRNLRGRMSSLTLTEQDLLAVEPGGYDLEKRRHKQFAHLRWRNTERFHDAPELAAHIEAVLEEHGRPVIHGLRQGVTFGPLRKLER